MLNLRIAFISKYIKIEIHWSKLSVKTNSCIITCYLDEDWGWDKTKKKTYKNSKLQPSITRKFQTPE